MDLLFCLATSKQVITSANHAGSFQLSMSVIKKGEDKNAKMKFSNDFMPKKINFLGTLKSSFCNYVKEMRTTNNGNHAQLNPGRSECCKPLNFREHFWLEMGVFVFYRLFQI